MRVPEPLNDPSFPLKVTRTTRAVHWAVRTIVRLPVPMFVILVVFITHWVPSAYVVEVDIALPNVAPLVVPADIRQPAK